MQGHDGSVRVPGTKSTPGCTGPFLAPRILAATVAWCPCTLPLVSLYPPPRLIDFPQCVAQCFLFLQMGCVHVLV